MPTWSQVLKPQATVTVYVGENNAPLTVTYRPQYLTSRFEELLRTIGETEELPKGETPEGEELKKARTPEELEEFKKSFLSYKSKELFKSLVKAWDQTDDEGNPVPITDEGLRDAPSEFLLEVVNKVMEATSPNETTRNE